MEENNKKYVIPPSSEDQSKESYSLLKDFLGPLEWKTIINPEETKIKLVKAEGIIFPKRTHEYDNNMNDKNFTSYIRPLISTPLKQALRTIADYEGELILISGITQFGKLGANGDGIRNMKNVINREEDGFLKVDLSYTGTFGENIHQWYKDMFDLPPLLTEPLYEIKNMITEKNSMGNYRANSFPKYAILNENQARLIWDLELIPNYNPFSQRNKMIEIIQSKIKVKDRPKIFGVI